MTITPCSSPTQHAFGELLACYRRRKPGLSKLLLAGLAGYDPTTLVRMCQGKKDLTGPSGRERVVRLMEVLVEMGIIQQLHEANALLLAANLPPLFDRYPVEARLIGNLSQSSTIPEPCGHCRSELRPDFAAGWRPHVSDRAANLPAVRPQR